MSDPFSDSTAAPEGTDAGPGRRSTEDLQRILESMMGDRQHVLSHELPDLLETYREATGVTILEEDELENVKQYCAANGDLELSPESLFTFLSIMTQADRIHTPSLPTSVSLPSGLAIQDTTPRVQRQSAHRRVSDRVRSPSDSSSSEDDLGYDRNDFRGRPRNERHVSAPPQSVTFPTPGSQTQLASLGQGHPSVPISGSNGTGMGRRKKTLSDSSRHEAALHGRSRRGVGSGPPPSSFAFGGGGGGFARPSPAGRRRRGSTSGHSASGEQDAVAGALRSPDGTENTQGYHSFSAQQQQMQRRRSSSAVSHHSLDAVAQSISHPGPYPSDGDRDRDRLPSGASIASMGSMGSMPLLDSAGPASPLSPNFGGVDHRPFHARAKSPDEMSEMMMLDDRHEEYDYGTDGMRESEEDGGVGEVEDARGDVGGKVGRLGRLATESSASLRTSHDKLRLLQKQNTELARKLKESERQLSSLGAENERLVEDLQDKLEEARAEIAQRRKDEKELKGKERAQVIQISGFEAEIQSLQRSLEHAKTNHASMQKMYNSQCEEAQRLRDTLLDRDHEIRALQAGAEAHAADEDKAAREIEALEAAITQLNTDLSSARQAESYLETQKQENLQLKETIDRMRYELDEARNNAVVAGHARGATTGTLNSVGGTMSRNLGDEISRRLNVLQDMQKGGEGEGEREEEEEVEEGDSYEETVITTQRTRRVGRSGKGKQPEASTRAEAGRHAGSMVIETSDGPDIRIEDGVREFADASVGTDPVTILSAPESGASAGGEPSGNAAGSRTAVPTEGPPAYTRDPPLDAQRILDDAHPREPLDPGMTASSSASSTFTLTPDGHHERSSASYAEQVGDVDPAYEELVQEVGMRCVVLEDEMRRKAEERRKFGQPRRSRASSKAGIRSAGTTGDGMITVYIDKMGRMSGNALAMGAGIAGAALVAGFAIGWSLNVPVPMRDHDIVASMNSLVFASALGAGEGLVPAYGRALWYSMGGAGNVLATRIPS